MLSHHILLYHFALCVIDKAQPNVPPTPEPRAPQPAVAPRPAQTHEPQSRKRNVETARQKYLQSGKSQTLIWLPHFHIFQIFTYTHELETNLFPVLKEMITETDTHFCVHVHSRLCHHLSPVQSFQICLTDKFQCYINQFLVKSFRLLSTIF